MSEAHEGMMVTPSVKLVRPLGEGGMGTVWIAEHLALRTQVVVKFIASGLKESKEAHERFSREAAAASQVKSPHVVQTFDHGITQEGTPYIVMELLEGRDLGEYLDAQGKAAPDLVVEIVAQLSRALDRAHERGIVHRDIKPGNIYLCDAGRDGEVFVKLLDFGIAKGVETPLVDSGTKTGSMIGSPFYMSPEQILGSKGVDFRSDLWSVGVVAFEALTGQKPFDAETMGGLAIKIHSEPLPLPSAIHPELPVAVDDWWKRACARNVEERFDSAKELAEALARAFGVHPPRSLEPPRLSTGGTRDVALARAPTLAAGNETNAGVVRAATPGRSSRLLVLLAIFLIVPPLAYVGFRAILKRGGDGAALVPPEPSLGAPVRPDPAAHAAPSASASTVLTPLTPLTPPEPASPAPSVTPAKVAGHGPRPPRPRDTGHASSSSPPSLPPTTAPPPRPSATGHDIF
ncbi:MAG: serine/threonine protein kinase [Labilithrix sp.]|nr:serine/threonine protein kinase [Labilithrix sp.]